MKNKGVLKQILLKKIEPVFMDTEETGNSQIWARNTLIEKGDHVYIVAPSGSGKTSLIHFIYGLRSDYNGSIFYDDHELKNFSVEDFSSYRQKNISIVFQDLRLFPQQTVWENIELKRVLYPFYSPARIEQMADSLGIRNKLGQTAEKCSYGEQQRIAIIRALVQPFDFLLLDEPFSHLDELNRMKAMDLILEECEKRKASMVLADLDGAMIANTSVKIHL